MKRNMFLSTIVSGLLIGTSALYADDIIGDLNVIGGSVNVFTPVQQISLTRIIYPSISMTAQDDSTVQWVLGVGTDTAEAGDHAVGFFNPLTGAAPLFVGSDAVSDLFALSQDKVIVGGKLGVGTESPTEVVDVLGTEAAARFQLTSETDTATEAAQFIQRRKKVGGSGAPLYGDSLGLFSFRGWNGANYTGSKGSISVGAYEDWDTGSNGTYMIISMTPKGSTAPQHIAKFMGDGNVYIPNGNLYVKGTKMNVPDYVFKDDYKLMPLEELKTFVQKNNHLPGVASADEVGKAGLVNLSGLQMTLLEKVEELTLYTLQQEEALSAKNQELAALNKRLERIEAIIENLAPTTVNR